MKCSEFLLSKFRALIPNKDAQALAQMVRSVEEQAFNKFSNNKVSCFADLNDVSALCQQSML